LTSASDNNAAQKQAHCPICDKEAVAEYAPFCSKRCADVDLHRWLTGQYAIPAQEDESDGPASESDEA